MSWASKRRELLHKVVVWSKSEQRFTDRIENVTFAYGCQLAEQIKREDPDLSAWVTSYYQ